MPAVYAHALFGSKVYKCLAGACRETVEKYKEYFVIGLQGPDLLFFSPFCAVRGARGAASVIHNNHASDFLKYAGNVIEELGTDTPECAYVLGFICHYMLDSACHPFVLQEIERTGIDHISLETEFEIELMTENGRNPYRYDLRRLLPYERGMACHISHVYKGVSAVNVGISARLMRLGKYLLTFRGDMTGRFMMFMVRLCGLSKAVFPHMIYPGKGMDTGSTNRELKRLLNGTVEETSEILMKFYHKRNNNPRFNMDFYGKE